MRMRAYDVAYNPPLPNNGEIPKGINEMDINELEQHIIAVCGKCDGDSTVCESCMGCLEGRTLINMINDVTKSDKISAKMAGIRAMYGISPIKKQGIAKLLLLDALMSDNPVEYIMHHSGVDERRAKDRLNTYRKKYDYLYNKIMDMKHYGDDGLNMIMSIREKLLDVIKNGEPVGKKSKKEMIKFVP